MKVLLFRASPNPNGSTNKLLSCFLENLKDIELKTINAYEEKVSPCIDCKYCSQNDGCQIKDDMQQIYEAIDWADMIILSSPVYYLSFPAPMKRIIDRSNALFQKNIVRKSDEKKGKKQGVLIFTSGASDGEIFSCVKAQAKLFFSSFSATFGATIFAPGLDTNHKETSLARACEEAKVAASMLFPEE